MKQLSHSSKKTEAVQPKAAKQAPVDSILNNYKENLQLKGTEDEETLQGKFESTQLKGKQEDDELLQGKFEITQMNSKEEDEPLQKKENNTGLPDNLKSGVENLSGVAMDDVKVHYNSSKPNELNAHAYAQGTDIHMAPGQEKHLPHEAWHVVQQKQGRVKPTMQMKGKVNVNNDAGLENEADVMGEKALQMHIGDKKKLENNSIDNPVIQGEFKVKDEVIVIDKNHPDYGNKGRIERRSVTNQDKWSVIIYKDDKLIRFFPYQLYYATDEQINQRPDVMDIQIDEEIEEGIDLDEEKKPQVLDEESKMEGSDSSETEPYRLHKSSNGFGDWIRLNLKKVDGSLVDNEGNKYKKLNIGHKNDTPFVSKENDKGSVQPTQEFMLFLETYNYNGNGSNIQDKLHSTIVKIQNEGTEYEKLVDYLAITNNAKWYTDHIRQGSLNELILTSDSVSAVNRGTDARANYDKHGRRGNEDYSFVELQRDTSYPTKDFVFKDVYEMNGKFFQNSHVNARMYYLDDKLKEHKTIGPVSPEYHLSMEKESLKFHFNKRTTMRSLVYDLIQLHHKYLATEEDILKVPANKRGKQIYELGGSGKLDLSNPNHLKTFASIVQNHTNSIIQKLKDIHVTLQDVPNGNSSPRAPLSPTYYKSVQSPQHLPDYKQ